MLAKPLPKNAKSPILIDAHRSNINLPINLPKTWADARLRVYRTWNNLPWVDSKTI